MKRLLAVLLAVVFQTALAGNPHEDPHQHKPDHNTNTKATAIGVGVGIADVDVRNDVDVSNRIDNDVKVNIDGGNSSSTAYGGKGGNGGSVVFKEGSIQNTTGDSNSESSSTSSVGDVAPHQEINLNQVYKQLPGVAHTQTPITPELQLYELGATAAEKGIDMTLAYNEICKPKSTGKHPLETEHKTLDKRVEVVFTPHQHYLLNKKSNGRNYVFEQEDNSPSEGEVSVAFPEEKVSCLGIMTSESVSRDGNVPLSEIESRSSYYALEKFGSFGRVYLVSLKDFIAASRGVATQGGGWNILPGLTRAFLGGDAIGALGGGLAGNNGRTFTGVRIGTTYIVMASDPNGFVLTDEVFKPTAGETAQAVEPAPQLKPEIVIMEKRVGPRQMHYIKPE